MMTYPCLSGPSHKNSIFHLCYMKESMIKRLRDKYYTAIHSTPDIYIMNCPDLSSYFVDEGSVRIWKDFSSKSTELNLVTAWQAISDLAPARNGM